MFTNYRMLHGQNNLLVLASIVIDLASSLICLLYTLLFLFCLEVLDTNSLTTIPFLSLNYPNFVSIYSLPLFFQITFTNFLNCFSNYTINYRSFILALFF